MTHTATPPAAQSLVRQAMEHLDRNRPGEAEAVLLTVLAGAPDDADALQLLGVIRRHQRRDAEAEELYRRSLAIRPGQPQVHHNLGNLLNGHGRTDEAIVEQNEAVRLRPNYLEAWLSLGHAYSEKEMFAEAEKCYRRALHIRPGHVFAQQSLGAALNSQGKAKEAETLLRQALAQSARDPRQSAALELNLAVSLQIQQRHDDALALLDAAQAKAPDMAKADYNRGNVLQRIGRLDEAVASYRLAIARQPLDLSAHRNLNHLLYRLERGDEFLRSYDDAAALHPEVGKLPLAKANFLFLVGEYDKAREAYERAMPLLPGNVTPHDGLGLLFARRGEFAAAIAAHETVVAMEPANVHGWVSFAETLLRAGDAERAAQAAGKAMALAPENQHALAMWGLALRVRDDASDETLNDYQNMVQVFELAPPEGYGDMESFNRDLNAYLGRLHTGKREFIDQSLRGGTQTLDDLFGVGHRPVELLRARIDEAIATYIACLRQDDSHPLLRRRRSGFRYAASWSSRLHDCGYHSNHVHPKGWISSAYYVASPQAIENAGQMQGWLKFGEPNFDARLRDPIRRSIKPVPGTLVLFPSYMWHGTVPFHDAAARTTIAFDVVPK